MILLLCDYRVRVFQLFVVDADRYKRTLVFCCPFLLTLKWPPPTSPRSLPRWFGGLACCVLPVCPNCYDTHTKCEACRGQVCSSDSFCIECESWSADFRKLYLRHKHSLFTKRVSKKNRKEGKSKSKSPRADAPPPPPPPVMMLLAQPLRSPT